MAWTSNDRQLSVGDRLTVRLIKCPKNGRLFAEDGRHTLIVTEDHKEDPPPEEGQLWECQIICESSGRAIYFEIKLLRRVEESPCSQPKARKRALHPEPSVA